MKECSMNAGRFALSAVAAAAMCLAASGASALGLGRVMVQSALGESLKAEIDVTSLTPEEASSLRVKVASPEAYKAQGVDYNAVLPAAQVSLQRRPDGRQVLRIVSDRSVQEPFIDVILEVSWSSGKLVREYTMLFDPPASRRAPPVQAIAPVTPSISAAPKSAGPRAQTRAAHQSSAVAGDASPGSDEYRVRPGDTLFRIAGKTQRPGASLEQMLVALYRGNPSAFIDNNMNRIKAGALLKVPSTEVAQQLTPDGARQIIQAQSADFGAYRQRLASGATTTKPEESARQASGKVQAAVDDHKSPPATTDRLTLSQGSAQTAGTEAKLSKDAEQKDSATRVAELTRNVEDLKKLSGAASANAGTSPGATGATAPAASAAGVTGLPAAPAAPASGSAVAALPSAPASAPEKAEASAASAPQVAAASAPVRATPPTRVADEGGFFENPMFIYGGVAIAALLGGLGFYRWRQRNRQQSGETSFLESRLQPDSFFGASGGQRIDTRDASGVSSSMSYSLSQLDAIGDVDPVAEADVYLAYGRDLQAEEILKEAMRTNPDRLNIRTKLLEVYAKRRDTKGFELLATQLYSVTQGEGEEWAKAQELGCTIDPDNPLYQAGGRPGTVTKQGDQLLEPLSASTMPQSVLPSASSFSPSKVGPLDVSLDDLDLNLDLPDAEPSTPAALESTQPVAASASIASPDSGLDFGVEEVTPVGMSAPGAAVPMEFNLDGLSLDLDPPPAQDNPSAPMTAGMDFPGLELPSEGTGDPEDPSDPLVRKLELAEEFRQIGDTEGARDLLEEVVAKANGSLRAKAQGMLSSLA
ncbi:MAG TPA: FimV/HubP family polar landmark protein [Burkholderiaceae bacterium]|nr:FimV/HubP family polar landmark protein [Burkholderiaceae bacterium]